jgi:hypothetical protein
VGGFQPPPLLPPGAGAPGGTSGGARFVWDDRDRVGLGQAFLETSRQVLTGPTAFYRSMPVTGGLGSPLLYALIAGWLGLAAAAVYQAIWVTIVGPTQLPFAVGRPELAELFAFLESWTGLVAQLVLGGISVVISVFVASGVLHVMLLILGGARHGFEATLRVVSFAQAPSLLLLLPFFLLPFCGLLLVVWSLALYAIGLAQAQQAGGGRAAAAVLLPILALCCCCSAALLTFAGAIASLVSHAR